MLSNRLQKRQRHLQKWAKRSQITCYRLYDRDMPDYPTIVDWYEGEAVVWLFGRKKDVTAVEEEAWQAHTLEEIAAGLALPLDKIFVKERFRQKGLDVQYERVAQSGAIRMVPEQGLTFEVNLSDYLDTGLFLDHRQTRQMVREQAKGKRVLNLFAYTGSFTVYAVDGGAASSDTVDLSQTYCDWAERNLQHNGVGQSASHRVIRQDCLQFLREVRRQGAQYHLIVCDPPTFSNSKRMKQASFAVQRDHPALIQDCLRLLAPGGELYFSNNAQRFKIDESVLQTAVVTEITQQTIPEDFMNKRSHRCWLITAKAER